MFNTNTFGIEIVGFYKIKKTEIMKKSILFGILFSIMIASCESHTEISEDKVPAAVVTAFKAKYPGATITKWVTEKKDGQTIYEAVFKQNNEEEEAEFNADGSFIKEH